MPLPANGILTLHGLSKPGDAIHSKPKQAMIVRMSEKTLNALASFPQHPQVDFEFGDAPGIHIGDVFYPMRPLKEDIPHDLYLRASSASKPTAPLKLYANVAGKFTVEPHFDGLSKKLRDSNLLASQARRDGKIVLVTNPPDGLEAPKGKKRKQPTSSMFRKPVPDSLKIAGPTGERKTSPLPVAQSSSQEGSTSPHPVRARLIRCLAMQPRSSEEAVKLVVPGCDDAMRSEVLNLLSDVAEPVKTNSSGEWQLRQRSWLEARLALNSLKVPLNDPAWAHVTFRSSDPTSSNGADASPKRGITSNQVKEKRIKPKAAAASTKQDVPMKDESARASMTTTKPPRPSPLKVPTVKDMQDATSRSDISSPPLSANARRLPGSGFKATSRGDTPTLPATASTSSTPTAAAEARLKNASLPAKPTAVTSGTSAKSSSNAAKVSQAKEDSEREAKAQAQAKAREQREKEERERAEMEERKAREKQREQREKEKERERQREKEREREKERQREQKEKEEKERQRREREHERKEMDRERERKEDRRRERIAAQEREEARAPKETTTQGKYATGTKRKKVGREEDDDVPLRTMALKKRKIEADDEPSILQSSSIDTKSRPPKKPQPSIKKHEVDAPTTTTIPSSQKVRHIKKESSPPPISRHSSSSTPTHSSPSQKHAQKPSEHRGSRLRQAPVYTSSEDEGEIRTPPKSSSLPQSSNTKSGTNNVGSKLMPLKPRPPLPNDRAGLRARYKSTYVEYIPVYSQMIYQESLTVRLSAKLADKMKMNEVVEDWESEIMEDDVFERLQERFELLKAELHEIKLLTGYHID